LVDKTQSLIKLETGDKMNLYFKTILIALNISFFISISFARAQDKKALENLNQLSYAFETLSQKGQW
jgi:hypothetical protein